MNELFECIGALVLAIIMLGIPVLCAFSLAFSWGGFIIIILSLLTMTDLIILYKWLCAFADFLSN